MRLVCLVTASPARILVSGRIGCLAESVRFKTGAGAKTLGRG
jgi:hypothetical protein